MNFHYLSASLIIVSVVFLFVAFFALIVASQRREVINCAQFSSQSDAQKTFDKDPIKYKRLDKGGVLNKPCESLK